MPDVVKQAFDAIKDSQLFLDEADFREQLSKSPKDVYGVLETTGLFLDYEDFSTSMALKKKDQTEFPEDVVEYYRGSGKESSGSPLQEQETPTPSELPKDVGSRVREFQRLSKEALNMPETETSSLAVDGGRRVVDIYEQEETWWNKKKKDWEDRKRGEIPYLPETEEEKQRIVETAHVPKDKSPLQGLSESEVRQIQFLELAASTSILGKLNILYNPEIEKESSAILQNYNPSQLEETAAHVLGFMFDAPIFMVLSPASGQAGKVLSSTLYKGGVESVKRKLLAKGVDPIIAEAVAYKTGGSTIKGVLGKLAESGTTSALTLGSYNMLSDAADQYMEALVKGENLKDYDWKRTLATGGVGAALGLTIGAVGMPFEYATGYMGGVIENTTLRSLAKGGVLAGDIVAESIVLGGVTPLMEGRPPEMGDFVSGLTFVLLMKGSQIPQKRLMESVHSRMVRRRDFTEDIPYTTREAKQLGVRLDPKQASFDINKKGDAWLRDMASDRNIPILTKMSVLYNEAGIRLNAFAEPASIKVKQEGKDFVVQTFSESKNPKSRYDLLAETVVGNKREADRMALLGNLQVFDNKVRKVVESMTPSQQGRLYDQIQRMKPEDATLLNDAKDVPTRLRTPEQHKVMSDYYKMVQKAVDSPLVGDSPMNSPMMRDATSSQGGLSVRRISPKSVTTPEQKESSYSITLGDKTETFTDKQKFLETVEALDANGQKVEVANDDKVLKKVNDILERKINPLGIEPTSDITQGEKVAQEGDKTISQRDEVSVPVEPSIKVQQFEIISKSNPMLDDVHTGIRREDDIKTAEEAFSESIKNDEDATPDFTKADMQQALETGRITVYSSKKIDAGVFVSPSKMQAEAYSGDGKVYSKEVNVNDVAWIDQFEGQYAKTSGSNTKLIDGKEKLLEQPKIETDAIQVEEAEGVPTRQEATVSEEVGQEVRGKDKTLLSKAEEEGVIASFEVPDKLTEARKTLSKFVNSQWAKLNLPKQKEKHFVNKSLKVDDVEQAIKLIEEVRQLSEMEGLKNKDTKEALAEWKKVNRVAINALPQRVRLVFERKSERLTTQNRDKTFTSLNELLTNEEYVKNVDSVARKIQEWKKRKFKGEVKDYTEGLSEIQVKAKHLFGKGDVRDFLNGVDITNDYFTPQLFAEMDMAMDALLSDKPSFSPIKSFMEDYRAMVDAIAVRKVTDVSLDEKTADKLKDRFKKLSERLVSIEKQMRRGVVDVNALMSIQREMKGLERVLDRFEHRLSYQDSDIIATLVRQMEDFFMGGYGGLSQKAKDVYERAMEMAVLQEVKKIQPRELRNNTEQEAWARVVRTARLVDFNGRTEQEKQSAKNRRVMVNPSTVEMLNHCVNEVEVSGIMPSSFYPAVSDFLSSVQAGDFLTFVENIRKGDMVEDGMFRLSKMTESTVKKVIRKESYLSGEYTTWHDSRFDMETGTDVPLERIFYTNMENAIIRAQTRATDDTQRYQKARRGAIGMSDKPMITTKSNYRQDVIENRIGIVMHNLHYYTMAEVKPKQVGDKFVLVDRGGERKEFGSYDEAYRIGNERKEKYLELDSFGRKIRNGEDIDAKLSSNIFETALFVKAQKEAYKSFGKEELIVRNMDDVKLLLKPKEVLVVKEIRKLLDGDVRDKVRATAYYEGKDVDLFGENYIPTDVRVSTDPKVVSEGIKKLVGNANKGLPIKATGHILPKMPVSEGWVDTNIDRIIKRYISDVYLSYEVLPVLKQEVKAMDAVGKRMKAMGEVPSDGFFSYREMEKFVKNFKWDRLNRYDINMKVGRRIPSKIGRTVGNVFVDISEGVDRTYDVARTLVLADVMRPYLDASSQLTKQFAELGLPAWDYGRFKEMVGVFEYLPEGSTMQTWMREGLTRYGDPGFIWGNSPFLKEMNDKFMGLADRFTKPLAWVAKFDEVYEALAGERFNAKRFIQDTEYRNEMINHPYFNQADVVAGNYTNRIHFARTQGALASMLFNQIKPGTSTYAWMMPVMAYTSQQFKSMLISNEKMFKGSKVGRDAEAKRMTGSVINGMWYSMNRRTLSALMDIVAAIVVGRWDRVKELWDEIKGVWSWEGLAANAISSISNIYLSGYTAVGTNLANLGIACFEVMEKRSADDPVMLRKIQDARKELKKVVGVGYYNVGDLEGGKVGIKQVVNVIAPVVGSFVYDAMDSGIKASEIFARKLDDFRSITKDEEKGMWYNALRVSYSLAFMVLGAPPTAKDLRRIVGENIRLSARLPFDKDIDNYMKEVDYIRQIGQYYDDVTTNAEFTDTQEGAVSVKVKVNGKWEEARTVGKGEDEILQVKEGLRWRDVTPEEELSKEFSALIKATELMQTKVDYDPRMFDKDEWFKAKADAEGILANFAEDDMSDEDLSFARDEMQVFLGDNWDVTGLPLIDLKKANAEVNGISSFQDAKRLIRDIDGRARKVRGKKEGDDKEFDTISRTYEHLNSWYKKNENDWAILTKLYNDIQIDRMLTNRQKFILYKMIKPEMQELMECIIRGDYYIGTFGRVEKSWREMERKMDKMEYDMEKKQMDVQIDMVLD